MKLVSVCMPTYKHESFIGESIESVLNQSYRNIELVICDNNVDDSTENVVKKFNDPRIVYIKNRSTIPVVENYNNAFKNARGDYISIIASDDYFRSDKIESQIHTIEQNLELALVFSNACLINEFGDSFIEMDSRFDFVKLNYNKSNFEWLKQFFYIGNSLFCTSVLFKRKLFDQIGFFNPMYKQLHDFDFWIRALSVGGIHIVNDNLLYYRVLGDNNLSAPCQSKSNRSNFEYSKVYRSFLLHKLDSLQRLDTNIIENNKLLLLAKLCINNPKRSAQISGFELLHQIYYEHGAELLTPEEYDLLTGRAEVYV